MRARATGSRPPEWRRRPRRRRRAAANNTAESCRQSRDDQRNEQAKDWLCNRLNKFLPVFFLLLCTCGEDPQAIMRIFYPDCIIAACTSRPVDWSSRVGRREPTQIQACTCVRQIPAILQPDEIDAPCLPLVALAGIVVYDSIWISREPTLLPCRVHISSFFEPSVDAIALHHKVTGYIRVPGSDE